MSTRLTKTEIAAIIEALTARLADEMDTNIPREAYERALEKLILRRGEAHYVGH